MVRLYDRRTRSVDTDRCSVSVCSRQSRWFDGALVASGFLPSTGLAGDLCSCLLSGHRPGSYWPWTLRHSSERETRAPQSPSLEVPPSKSVLAVPCSTFFLLKFHLHFSRVGRWFAGGGDAALRHSTQESAMQRVFIIAIMFLGITAAQGQTVTQPNGHTNSSIGATNSSESAVGSDPVGVSTSSLSSGSSTSPSSQSGTVSGSPAATGSASGGARATSSGAGAAGSGSTSSQAPLLLPGEIPDTSTQAASTTATAPSSSSPICPPPVPSTDGGSVNLTEIAGASLGGC
jgi:hypothetical protein